MHKFFLTLWYCRYIVKILSIGGEGHALSTVHVSKFGYFSKEDVGAPAVF
jgi:hypothetical protein